MGFAGVTAAAAVAVLLLLISGAATVKPEKDPWASLARWLYILNGDFIGQLTSTDAEGNQVVNVIQSKFIPVKVPGIDEPTTLKLETSPDVTRHFLIVWTVDDNYVGHGQVYRARASDLLRGFHDRGPGMAPLYLPVGTNIKHVEGVTGVFEEIENTVFELSVVDSTRIVNGDYPLYLGRVTCDSLDFQISIGNTSVMYHYERQGNRYPQIPEVENKLKDIPNPCEQ